MERPVERPANFHPGVLWTLQECHRDPTAYRGSRVNLNAAIRNKDGSVFENVEILKNTARIYFLSSMAHLSIPLNAPKHQTGLWWKTYRPDEWRAALHHMEVSHPVVTYCAYHWKAEEILRVVIQTRLDSERARKEPRQQERMMEILPTSPMKESTTVNPPKRPHSTIGGATNGLNAPLEQPANVSKPPKKKRRRAYDVLSILAYSSTIFQETNSSMEYSVLQKLPQIYPPPRLQLLGLRLLWCQLV